MSEPSPVRFPQLTADEVRSAEAAYKPFPSFGEWMRVCAPLDVQSWEVAATGLRMARAQATEDAIRSTTQTVLREAAWETAAIEGLYDTNRGFTYSVATQAAGWEIDVEELGSHARPLFEAQLHTYELLLDAATQRQPIGEAFIRRTHEEITAAQPTHRVLTSVGWQDQTLPKGVYKTQPNHPWGPNGPRHLYAPVDATSSEMHRLVEELQTPQFEGAHPVHQAAYAHYAFVSVHPFADGNGRVARALTSIYLYRAVAVPLVIYKEQTARYHAALAHADEGDFLAFATFVQERSIGTLDRVQSSLLNQSGEGVDAALARIRARRPEPAEWSVAEMDRLADLVAGLFRDLVVATWNELQPPPYLSASVNVLESRDFALILTKRGFVQFQSPLLVIGLRDSRFPDAGVEYEVAIRPVGVQRGGILVALQADGDPPVVANIVADDLLPEITEDLRERLSLTARRAVRESLARLSQ